MKISGLVSIVTPMYNSEKFIGDTIESVIAQSYDKWEMIIVDDKSTDSSVDIVENVILKNKKIKLIKNEKNEGAAVSRNIALGHTCGEYIAFLDADDIWNCDKLLKHITFMEEFDVGFTYSNYGFIDIDGSFLDYYMTAPKEINRFSMLLGNKVGCLTVVSRSEYFDFNIPRSIKKRNDYAMWLKVLRKTNGYLVDDILASYRITNTGISSGSKIRLLKHHYKVFRISEEFGIVKSLFLTTINGISYLHNKTRVRRIKK